MSDPDLLARYAHHGDHDAFRTLVERHLDLVYSVARRHLRDSAAAEDVAQAVFVQLARHARQLKPGTPLVAWLHLVSRRTALNALRGEIRRQARESAAVILQTMNPPPPAWSEIEPLLDEAVDSLAETDRSAILLRFFENKSLREVGAALGASDDAAQKRVSRAVEELRTFFQQRGVAISATALAADLATHTLHTAPTGLASAIAHAAVLTGAGTAAAVVETSRVLAMTTLQKIAIAVVLATTGGFGLYEAALVARQADDLRALREQNEQTSAEIRNLRLARDGAAGRLKSTEAQIDARLASARAIPPADAALEAQMREWFSRVDRLKDFLARHPELSIPELQLVKDEVWLTIVSQGAIDSEDKLHEAAAQVRRLGENLLAPKLSEALRAYLKAHDNTLPARPQDLAPFLDPSVDPAMLDRYEMLRTGRIDGLAPADRRNVLSAKSPVDPEFDAIWSIGPTGYGTISAMGVNFREALRQFNAQSPGQRPTSAAQLRPYLKWPVRDEAVQKFLDLGPAPSR